MRDGPYKTSASPTWWQDVARMLTNDADWHDGGLISACRAILKDLHQVDAKAMHRLVERLAAPQRDLFQGAMSVWQHCNPDTPPSVLEAKALEIADHEAAGRPLELEHVVRGLAEATSELVEARLSQVRTDRQARALPNAADFTKRMGIIIKQVPVYAYAEMIVETGRMPMLPRLKGSGPNMNEDLS